MRVFFLLFIPVIFFLVVELYLTARRDKNNWSFRDTFLNLSIGMFQQTFEITVKIIIVKLYVYASDYSLFEIEESLPSFLVFFVLFDLSFYIFHRLGHEFNFIWAFHSVHHQSEHFNFSLGFRNHFLHKLIVSPYYLIFIIIGFSMDFVVLGLILQTGYQYFLHTKLIKNYGVLSFVFVSPDHHRVHHSAEEIHFNKNFGGIFILWDKWFNTFVEESEPVKHFGIGGAVAPIIDPLQSNLDLMGYKRLVRKVDVYKSSVSIYQALAYVLLGLFQVFLLYNYSEQIKLPQMLLLSCLMVTVLILYYRATFLENKTGLLFRLVIWSVSIGAIILVDYYLGRQVSVIYLVLQLLFQLSLLRKK
ncbi:MAG: hypothetical protein Roseis2KO_31910 [Roseivirga sp.]